MRSLIDPRENRSDVEAVIIIESSSSTLDFGNEH